MITVDINDLRDLVREAGDEPVLTLYVSTDPADPANHRDAGTRSWEVELRSDLHRIGLAACGLDVHSLTHTLPPVWNWPAVWQLTSLTSPRRCGYYRSDR